MNRRSLDTGVLPPVQLTSHHVFPTAKKAPAKREAYLHVIILFPVVGGARNGRDDLALAPHAEPRGHELLQKLLKRALRSRLGGPQRGHRGVARGGRRRDVHEEVLVDVEGVAVEHVVARRLLGGRQSLDTLCTTT